MLLLLGLEVEDSCDKGLISKIAKKKKLITKTYRRSELMFLQSRHTDG